MNGCSHFRDVSVTMPRRSAGVTSIQQGNAPNPDRSMGGKAVFERTDGLKPFNFKSPYVTAAWILGAVGCFGTLLVLDLEFVKGTKEAFAVLLITVVFAGAPLALAFWLDYREAPEGTTVPEEEVESLLDFLDERDDLK